MADHLPLPGGRPLESRRQQQRPTGGVPPERSEHSDDLKRSLEEIEARVGLADEDEEFDPPVILKIDAATRIPDGPFRNMDLQVLGEGQRWTYAVLTNRESRALFERLLNEYGEADQDQPSLRPMNLVQALDDIRGIELYGPDDRLDPELNELSFERPEIVDVSLWPSADEEDAQSRVADVTQALSSPTSVAEVLLTDQRPWTTLMRVRVDRAGLAVLSREGWVERIRPPLSSPITMRDILGAKAPERLPDPVGGQAIGIIDGVCITQNPLLTQHTQSSRVFPEGHVFAEADDHGTAVASLAVWGNLDFVVFGRVPPSDSVPILSARVLDIDRTSNRYVIAGLAHETVEQALRWLAEEHGVRIANVSINRPSPESGLLRSDLTYTIDTLARELDIVVVVSAGNNLLEPPTGWLHGYPDYLLEAENEVTPPGDGAISVSVGAVARREVPAAPPIATKVAVAPSGGPAPFSRTGPVRNHLQHGRAKPEFAHDGGNVVYDQATTTVSFNDPGTSVPVATRPFADQILSTETGTSFAAPAVAHEIANIATRYPDASANSLRALTALSARRTEPTSLSGFDSVRGSVYGVPDAARVLESGGTRAILTFEGEIPTGVVVVHELPVPYDFAVGRTSRSLRIALAFDPPVRRTRREYIAGTMAVELVRGLTFEEVSQHYQRQPSIRQAEDDPNVVRRELPPRSLRPWLAPGAQRLASSTLIRQDYVDQLWDPDLENYFLVVTHTQSAWSPRQRRDYDEQRYALAVELAEHERNDLDVHNLVRAEIEDRARVTPRIRARR